jgi:hypothetical protein
MNAGSEIRTRGGMSLGETGLEIYRASLPTQGDLLFAVFGHKTDILERTSRGMDWQGKAFAPYSEKGPYYYSPGAKGGGRGAAQVKREKGAATRAFRKLSGGLSASRGTVSSKRGGTMRPSRTGRSLVFESYRAFKQWARGSGVVDLTGPSAPHMLQAMQVYSRNAPVAAPANDAEQATEVRLSIHGDEGGRASGHHFGNPNKKLPQRRFMGANDEDVRRIQARLEARRVARMGGT